MQNCFVKQSSHLLNEQDQMFQLKGVKLDSSSSNNGVNIVNNIVGLGNLKQSTQRIPLKLYMSRRSELKKGVLIFQTDRPDRRLGR